MPFFQVCHHDLLNLPETEGRKDWHAVGGNNKWPVSPDMFKVETKEERGDWQGGGGMDEER